MTPLFKNLRAPAGDGGALGARLAALIRGGRPAAPKPATPPARPSPLTVADGACFLAIAQIDRFDALKRTIGYSHANALIAEFCDRVRTCLPASEVGRAGRSSIEFVFPARTVVEARIRLMAVGAALARPVELAGSQLRLSVTIGAADAQQHPISDELVALAEAALADAQARHLKIAFADATAARETVSRLALMRDLGRALESDTLALHYQPKLVARTGAIDSAEALVRWHHPEHGPIGPDIFVRIAEETGNVRALTEWVTLRAIEDARRLQAAGHDLIVHVNVPALLLPDPDFAAWVLARVPANEVKIGFEITETAMIGDPQRALANLTMFAAAGIRLAIDDYGTGFSSLAYLQQLPVDEIKLDRSFVAGLTERHRDPLLVRSTIDLAHALDMQVTAEGIETPEALALLQIMGCDRIQGYLIARPMPLASLLDFLASDDHRKVLTPAFPLADQLRRRNVPALKQGSG